MDIPDVLHHTLRIVAHHAGILGVPLRNSHQYHSSRSLDANIHNCIDEAVDSVRSLFQGSLESGPIAFGIGIGPSLRNLKALFLLFLPRCSDAVASRRVVADVASAVAQQGHVFESRGLRSSSIMHVFALLNTRDLVTALEILNSSKKEYPACAPDLCQMFPARRTSLSSPPTSEAIFFPLRVCLGGVSVPLLLTCCAGSSALVRPPCPDRREDPAAAGFEALPSSSSPRKAQYNPLPCSGWWPEDRSRGFCLCEGPAAWRGESSWESSPADRVCGACAVSVFHSGASMNQMNPEKELCHSANTCTGMGCGASLYQDLSASCAPPLLQCKCTNRLDLEHRSSPLQQCVTPFRVSDCGSGAAWHTSYVDLAVLLHDNSLFDLASVTSSHLLRSAPPRPGESRSSALTRSTKQRSAVPKQKPWWLCDSTDVTVAEQTKQAAARPEINPSPSAFPNHASLPLSTPVFAETTEHVQQPRRQKETEIVYPVAHSGGHGIDMGNVFPSMVSSALQRKACCSGSAQRNSFTWVSVTSISRRRASLMGALDLFAPGNGALSNDPSDRVAPPCHPSTHVPPSSPDATPDRMPWE